VFQLPFDFPVFGFHLDLLRTAIPVFQIAGCCPVCFLGVARSPLLSSVTAVRLHHGGTALASVTPVEGSDGSRSAVAAVRSQARTASFMGANSSAGVRPPGVAINKQPPAENPARKGALRPDAGVPIGLSSRTFKAKRRVAENHPYQINSGSICATRKPPHL
jgi:hypothetical protein